MKIYTTKNIVTSNNICDLTKLSRFFPNVLTQGPYGSQRVLTNGLKRTLTGQDNYSYVVEIDVAQFLSAGRVTIFNSSASVLADLSSEFGWYITTNLSPNSDDSDYEYKTDGYGILKTHSNDSTTSSKEWFTQGYGISIMATDTNVLNVINGHDKAYLFIIGYGPFNSGGISQNAPALPYLPKAAYSSTMPADSYATTSQTGWFKEEQSKMVSDYFRSIGNDKIYRALGNWYNQSQTDRKMVFSTVSAGNRVVLNNSTGNKSAVFQIPTSATGKDFYICLPKSFITVTDINNIKLLVTTADGTTTPLNSGTSKYFYGELITLNSSDISYDGPSSSAICKITCTDDVAGKWIVLQAQVEQNGSTQTYNDTYDNYIKASSTLDCMRVAATKAELTTTAIQPFIEAEGWYTT